MDVSSLTDAPPTTTTTAGPAPRPSADNEAAMLLLGLFEQPPSASAATPVSAGQVQASGGLQGYQAERPSDGHTGRISPNSTKSGRPNQPPPNDHLAPRPSASPATRPESLKSLSPIPSIQSSLGRGEREGTQGHRMLPPVPPAVAQKAQQQPQSDHASRSSVSVNGTNNGYRIPETYHSQSVTRQPGSYSHQPLTATSSKSPLLTQASPKQGFSAPVMGTFNRPVPPSSASVSGSPNTSYVSPVISTGQNRISHLLNNPTSTGSGAVPASPNGRNGGHSVQVPYHTHTYSSQPYKLVSTNNGYASAAAGTGVPTGKAQVAGNGSRTVYSGKQENGTTQAAAATSEPQAQGSIRGYESTIIAPRNGTHPSPLHYPIPTPYLSHPTHHQHPHAHHQLIQPLQTPQGMQYVSVQGKGGLVYAAVPNGMEQQQHLHQHQQHLLQAQAQAQAQQAQLQQQQQQQAQAQAQHVQAQQQQSQSHTQSQAKLKPEPTPGPIPHQYPIQPRPASPVPSPVIQNEPVQAQPPAPAVHTPAPRKRKRSASGSTSTKGLQPKSANSGAVSVTTTTGSNARPDLPHFMGFDNQLYRCICETTIEPERGSSIQCEQCLAWQHAGCFGISEDTLEGLTYYCHICKGGNFTKNDEYIAYVRDLETRLMSGQLVSGILSVNPTLQLVPETAAVRDSKKTRGGARGRPRARENSQASGVRPSVGPPDSAATESFPTDHEMGPTPNANEKATTPGANMPRPQRRKTGTTRAPKHKGKDVPPTPGALPDTTAQTPVSSKTGRLSTTHSPDREIQRTTRENTAALGSAPVVTDSSSPSRLFHYTPIQQNMIRGQLVRKIIHKFLAEWTELEELAPTKRQEPNGDLAQTEGTVTENARHQDVDMESTALRISQDILGPPTPPAIIKSDLEDAAVPTYVKAKDKDEVFFFPPGRAFLSVPDPKDAPATPSIRPSPVFGVHVRRTAGPGDFLGEFKGEIMDSESYHRDPINQYATLGIVKPFIRRLGPPVDLVVDGRIYSNDMRFVRSGCHPNAVFRPIVHYAKGSLKPSLSFGIFASSTIAAGQEIILGWEWDDDHIVHTLRPDAPTIPKGSRVQHRCALVTGHLLGTFRSCACEDETNCVWIRLMQMSVAGQPIPSLNFRSNKKSRKTRDTTIGYGPLIGAIRGWRKNEIARFEAELETELLQKHDAAFEAEQVEEEEYAESEGVGEVEDDVMQDEMEIDPLENGDILDDVEEEDERAEREMTDAGSVQDKANVESRKSPSASIRRDPTPANGIQVNGKTSAAKQVPGKQQLQDDNAVSKSPVSSSSELDINEDGSDDEKGDVDMEDGRDSPADEPAVAAQTHSPKDDLLQTPPAADAAELPSIMDIDRHSLEGLGASPEGVHDHKSPPPRKASSSVYRGRTAEDDSPLTSADTRETPSPLMLSADNAFLHQMGDRDHSEDEDDGNLSDATASTVPLSRHSDDDDDPLSEAETEKSRPRSEARHLQKGGNVPPPQAVTPRAGTPTNGKVTSTTYKRRRVMSPSSPIEEDTRDLTSPSERGSPIYPRKGLPRAPSSSLSPVLPSNSLAEMFDEEETQTYKQRQPTPIKKDQSPRATPLRKASMSNAEIALPTLSSKVDTSDAVIKENGGESAPSSAPMSDGTSVPPTKVDDKAPSEAATSSQPEPEPAPPPKKRKLDLKKFMAAKLQSPADVTVTANPFEAPAPPVVTLQVQPTEEPAPIVKEPVASPFAPSIPAPLPCVAAPPPHPAVTSPVTEKPAELGASPWWTAPTNSRPSFTSYTETRPIIGELSGARLDNLLGMLNQHHAAAPRNDIPKPTTAGVSGAGHVQTAPAAASPPPDIEVKLQAAREPSSSEGLPQRNGSFDFGSEAPKQELLPPLASPSAWQAKLPPTIPSHWSRIPPALEQKDLPPHVDPEARRVDRFGPLTAVVRSPPKPTLPLTSPQRLPPAGPRASLVPVRPLEYKEVRDPVRDARETERERELREREREREVPRGPRMEYRGRGGAPRGTPFTPRGGWHGDTYRGRGRGTGEFRGRGFFPRGRGAFFNSRGRGT